MMTVQQGVYLKSAGMMQRPPFENGGWRNEEVAMYTDMELIRWLMNSGYVLIFDKDRLGFFKKTESQDKAKYVPVSDITDALVDVCCLVCNDSIN